MSHGDNHHLAPRPLGQPAGTEPGRYAPRRPGFTLVEMLVSLAVLAVALTIVGVVFNVTVDTTRRAAAYSEAQNWTRQFLLQIEEDLQHCQPTDSVLVLVGRTQAAARTQADLEAGKFWRVLLGDPTRVTYDPEYGTLPALTPPPPHSDPRADILMFFTNRPTMSQAPNLQPQYPPGFATRAAQGAKFSPVEVVYGHAALDDASYNAGTRQFMYAGNPRHIEQNVGGGASSTQLSRIPAVKWHLSRRATILRNPRDYPFVGATLLPQDIQFLPAASQNIVSCTPYNDGYDAMPGDAARLDLPLFLQQFGPNSDYPPTATLNQWFRPYTYPDGVVPAAGWDLTLAPCIDSLLYATGTGPPRNHHVATVVENPPADLAHNLGVQMLPGCAWFQVEFLMPEDPRNSLEYSGNPYSPGVSQRWDMPHWTEIEPGRTYVFVPDTAENRALVASQIQTAPPAVAGTPIAGSRLADYACVIRPGLPGWTDKVDNRIIRMWPYAIRITVRVFDREGRLNEPIMHTLVHRFD